MRYFLHDCHLYSDCAELHHAGRVFTLITSVSTVCFIFVWGIMVICHMRYKRTQPELARVKAGSDCRFILFRII